MEQESGSSEARREAAASKITDPGGPASFLDAVRTLVHGEQIPAQRPESDDWLPGRWAAEEPAKSQKLGRRGRRGRTVEASAQEGVPGAEGLVERTERAPGPDVAVDAVSAPADVGVQPELEPAPAPGDGEPAGSGRGAGGSVGRSAGRSVGRWAAKEQARAERQAAKAVAGQATAERRTAKARATAERKSERKAARARAGLERRVARIAKAQAGAERKAATAQARADRVAAKTQAGVERVVARSEAKVERATAKAQARVARSAAKANAKAEHAVSLAHEESALEARLAETGTESGTEPLARRGAGDESLAGYIARVEAQRVSPPPRPTRLRTALKVSLVTLVVAACAVVPWAAPQFPDALAGLLPWHDGPTGHVKDPPVSPPTAAVVGPVGVEQQAGPYDGVRLEAAGWPREVQVDRLHVDSDVVPISGQSGSLLPPSDPQLLGWWKEGRPVGAQYGTAVITGHTVHTGGGALDHLDQLVVGDSVRVRTDAGWIRYVVQRTQIYATEQLARDAEDLFRLGGTGRLVLITCDDWNGEFYESNAVVVATPVEDLPS